MDLASRLRSVIRPGAPVLPGNGAPPRRELTYEPDDGRRYEAQVELERVADALGGRLLTTTFGRCLAIDRRYESERWHGDVQIGDCELSDFESLRLLDSAIVPDTHNPAPRAVFIDLETTGLSGGAGTVAFLVGCAYFDAGALQVRQFLLSSFNAERALLSAAAELFDAADLIVTYNGKTFDVPVMETRWAFHRMPAALDELPHFDMLHPARRLWRSRSTLAAGLPPEGGRHEDAGGCRLTTLERVLLNLRRVGDVDGFEIPGRFFQFLRTGDARPLEPVLEHNRLDLVSLAAVTSRALRLAGTGEPACRDGIEALAVGRVLERGGALERAEACYRRASQSQCLDTRAESFYRLGLRCRRSGRFEEAAEWWRQLVALTDTVRRRDHALGSLREFAIEALAIHQEHRARDLQAARELALFALEEDTRSRRADGMRHRLARLDRKLAKKQNGPGLKTRPYGLIDLSEDPAFT
jgi:uncharacterized protein YprB with RNaseH-like and TPR domain